MDDKEVLKLWRSIDYGTIIMYKDDGAVYPTYLVVKETKDGIVRGQMAHPVGVNSISLEELLKKEGLSIAEFKPFKSQ